MFSCAADSVGGHSLESLVRENTTAGSRYGRLSGGSSSQYAVGRGKMKVPPFAIKNGTYCCFARRRLSRARKSRFATGTQCGGTSRLLVTIPAAEAKCC